MIKDIKEANKHKKLVAEVEATIDVLPEEQKLDIYRESWKRMNNVRRAMLYCELEKLGSFNDLDKEKQDEIITKMKTFKPFG